MERNGTGALAETAPTEQKECFGTHPWGIYPDCLLCLEEDSCHDNTVREVSGFICPNCGGIYLMHPTGRGIEIIPVESIDAEGEVTLGKPAGLMRETSVLHCICGHVLWDEDIEDIDAEVGIPYIIRKWFQDHPITE